MMKKLPITTFFVAILATPAMAQSTDAPAPAMASAMTAPQPATRHTGSVAMRPAPRPVTMRTAIPPKKATTTPVMASAALPPLVAAPTTPTMALSDQPVMSAAPQSTATTTKKDSKGSVVGGWVLQLLLGIMGIALPIILTPVVFWILKKMKVEDAKVKKLVDEMVDKAVGVGIHYAEEQAHKLKDDPVDGAKKLDMAGKKAQAYLKDSGIVDKGADYIKDLIEARLGEERSNVPVIVSKEKKKDVEEEKESDDG